MVQMHIVTEYAYLTIISNMITIGIYLFTTCLGLQFEWISICPVYVNNIYYDKNPVPGPVRTDRV